MIYPELKDAPSIISIQSDDSNNYPVAIGVLISGISYQWFIAPKDEWLKSGYSVTQQQHLTVEFLLRHGLPPSDVTSQLLSQVPDYKLFFSLDAERDIALMKMLDLEMTAMLTIKSEQDVLNADCALGLSDIRNLIDLTSLGRLIDEQRGYLYEYRLNPNYAADLSVAMGFAVQKILDEENAD